MCDTFSWQEHGGGVCDDVAKYTFHTALIYLQARTVMNAFL